jgi:heptaprenyl diphosphate synthase
MKPYRIPELANKYVSHDLIKTYTDLPAFPDARVRLLYTFLNDADSASQHTELYALVASLVQMGMDTHDLIDTETERKPEKEMRSRQLKVLAGDYFSSRFYHLLSQAGQIDMIRKISSAVCEVNRLKMNLYIRMNELRVEAEAYINHCVELKAELFLLFGGLLEERFSAIWPELLHGFARCEVVVHELSRMESPNLFDRSWGYWTVMEEGTDEERKQLAERPEEEGFVRSLIAKYQLRSRLNDILHASVADAQKVVGKLESDKLINELCQIGESFLRPFASTAAAYNETR